MRPELPRPRLAVSPAPSGQRGLTLLETLVTLVLVALVAGLMSQGMFQVARIEQLLQGQQLVGQLETLRRVWVQQALEGLMPGATDSSERFTGNAIELTGLSSLLPLGESQGPVLMRLRIDFDPGLGQSRVLLSRVEPLSRPAGPPVALLQWPGQRGSWRYLDESGSWQPQWPPLSFSAPSATSTAARKPDALPRLIALDPGQGEAWLVVARPQASAQALGQRIDRDKLP